jgi:diguanylate cyclase (GGDEF)-like protein
MLEHLQSNGFGSSADGSTAAEATDVAGTDGPEEEAADLDSLIRYVARKLSADGAMLTVRDGLPGEPRIYSSWGLPLGRTVIDEVSGVSNGHAPDRGKPIARRLDSTGDGDGAQPAIVQGFVAPVKSPSGTRGALTIGYISPIADRKLTLSALSSYASVVGLWLDDSAALVELLQASFTDGLTGCLTYPALLQRLEDEQRRSARTRQPLACLFVDLDGFERINDSDGRLAGNRILVAVANAIRARVRATDSVARFGGEEFVVLLPNASTLQAQLVADSLQETIAHASPANGASAVTASIGVSELQSGMKADELIDRADASLRQRRTADARALSAGG